MTPLKRPPFGIVVPLGEPSQVSTVFVSSGLASTALLKAVRVENGVIAAFAAGAPARTKSAASVALRIPRHLFCTSETLLNRLIRHRNRASGKHECKMLAIRDRSCSTLPVRREADSSRTK